MVLTEEEKIDRHSRWRSRRVHEGAQKHHYQVDYKGKNQGHKNLAHMENQAQ